MITQPKHTPEPWVAEQANGSLETAMFISAGEKTICALYGDWPDQVGDLEQKANASRIVSCVNALAGIPDPEEFVKAAKELLERSRYLETAARRVANGTEQPSDYLLKMAEKMRPVITRAETAFGGGE